MNNNMRFNLIDYMARPILNAADFSGRANRLEMAINIAAFFGMQIIGNILGNLFAEKTIDFFALLFALLSLTSCMIRRFHDQNKPASILLIILIPAVGYLILAIMLFFDGTNDDNEYGRKPL